MPRFRYREAIDRLWDRSIILKNDEKREEFRWIQYRAQYAKGEAKARITFLSGNALSDATEGAIHARCYKNISGLSSQIYSIRIYEGSSAIPQYGRKIVLLVTFVQC